MSDRKTLLITGASSGIGAATARAAVAAGWNVALFARSEDKLTAVHAELGDARCPFAGDATHLLAQEDAVARTVEHFGGSTRPLPMPVWAWTRPAPKRATRRNGAA